MRRLGANRKDACVRRRNETRNARNEGSNEERRYAGGSVGGWPEGREGEDTIKGACPCSEANLVPASLPCSALSCSRLLRFSATHPLAPRFTCSSFPSRCLLRPLPRLAYHGLAVPFWLHSAPNLNPIFHITSRKSYSAALDGAGSSAT